MYKRFLFLFACSFVMIFLASCGGNPVSVSTDQSSYKATTPMKVSITNSLNAPIYAVDGLASCSILTLEVQKGDSWLKADSAPCASGHTPATVKINVGQTYTTTVGGSASTLAGGNYRLVLNYSASPSMATTDTHPGTKVISQTLNVG